MAATRLEVRQPGFKTQLYHFLLLWEAAPRPMPSGSPGFEQ